MATLAAIAEKSGKSHLLYAATIIAFVLSGCSSKKQEEDVAATQQSSDTAAEAPESPEEATQEAAAPDAEDNKSETAAADPVAPAPTEAVTGNGEAVVKYVKAKSCPVLDAPNGKEVGKLTKGEHLLVWSEGEWSKTSAGQFVATKHLTTKGVARDRSPATWNAGIAH